MKKSNIFFIFTCFLFVIPIASTLNAQSVEVQKVEKVLLAKAANNIERHRKGQAEIQVVSPSNRPLAGTQIEIEQTGHHFLFGCIIFELTRSEAPYQEQLWKQRFKELFNYGVLPFYWAGYERKQDQTNLANIDKGIRWCQENDITTKGHPLVWTNKSGVPAWIKSLPVAQQEELLWKRVRREVGGLRGKIDIWDVVNEPVNCRAWENINSSAYIKEPIDRIADYVEKAFRAAHQSNPTANLILNEFNTIAVPQTRERFYQLVVELKKRKTPISGLGIQAHEPRQHWYPPQETWKTFEKLASLGYPLHITEFIPQSADKPITGVSGLKTAAY